MRTWIHADFSQQQIPHSTQHLVEPITCVLLVNFHFSGRPARAKPLSLTIGHNTGIGFRAVKQEIPDQSNLLARSWSLAGIVLPVGDAI